MSDTPEKPSSPETPASPAPPVVPVSTSQPSPENEKIPRTANQPKAGVVEKVRSAAARVLTEAGFEFHKGRGRPKNCPACKNRLPEKSACADCKGTGVVPGKLDRAGDGVSAVVLPVDFPENQERAGTGDSAPPDTSVTALFRRSVVASVRGVLGILKTIVSVYANAAGCREEFTEKTLAKAEPDPDALKDFTESLDVVLKKRNIQPENAEEWALAINGARLLAPYAMLIAEFKGEMRRNRFERASYERQSHEEREKEKAEIRAEFAREQAAKKAGEN